MKILLGILISSQLLFPQVPAFADPARREKLMTALPKIDALFEKYLRDRQAPGLVYGVVIDQELVHVKTFGVSNTKTQSAVKPDTMFRIASMTKSFTALAILKLRDAGKLSLDDPASRWVPELSSLNDPTKDSAPVTVRQLLTHGAGFPEDNPWGDRQLAIPDAQFSRWVDQGIPFSTSPDTSFEYSNYGFALLGRIVAKASGQPYDQYLQREILRPLGLKSTTLEPATIADGRQAIGYDRRGEEFFEIPSLAHGSFGAMGGLVTDAQDLGRYIAFQLAAEPSRNQDDKGPVRRSSLREMQRQWRTSNFSATQSNGLRAVTSGYGYGLSVSRDCKFQKIVAHGGGLPGFGSYMMWLPEYGVGLFAMANLTYAGPAAPMREALDLLSETGALNPRALPPSNALRATQKTLLDLWNQWSDTRIDQIVADNLYLDQPRKDIQASFENLKKKYTSCEPIGDIRPENWLRGTFRLACQQGQIQISFTLAPTKPPRLQFLRLTEIAMPNDALRTAADARALQSPYGKCTVKETLWGNGQDSASFRIACPGGDAQMSMLTSGDQFKATFTRAPGESCTP